MPEGLFDDLTRALAEPVAHRRRLLAGVVASALVAFGHAAQPGLAGKKRRRRRRRRNRNKVQLCHDGLMIRVRKRAGEAHLQHGDQLGSCGLEPGAQTCENAKLPCNANPTFCGPSDSGCACFVTTTGGSLCAEDQFQCFPDKSTCTVDSDCGDGFACVPSTGCVGITCGGNGNACAPACQSQE